MMQAMSTTDMGIPDLTRPFGVAANVELCAVLTKDSVGLYAVYVGIVPATHDDERKKMIVMGNGSKLSYSKARMFYPDLQEREYRK